MVCHPCAIHCLLAHFFPLVHLTIRRAIACLMATACDETAEFMGLFSTQREFSAYGPSYWAVIAAFAIGAALLVWIGRRQTESQARRLGHVLGVLTAWPTTCTPPDADHPQPPDWAGYDANLLIDQISFTAHSLRAHRREPLQ